MTTPEQHEGAPCAATGCTQPQAAGSQLCAVDGRKLGDWIAKIGTEYELLSAAPSMQGRDVGCISGGTLAAQRSPGSTHVMTIRDPRRGTGRIGWDDADPYGVDDTPSVLATLASYADRVREGRDLVEQVTHVKACLFPCMHRACLIGVGHAVPVPLTVARERKLLATHLQWILEQDWCGEFFDEIRGLWGLLRAANGHATPGPRVRCRELVDGKPCAGTVRWVDGAAVCRACGATKKGSDLLRIAAGNDAA
jgi:hypothetical protein